MKTPFARGGLTLLIVLLMFSAGVTNYWARRDLPIRLPPETLAYLKQFSSRLDDIVIDVKPLKRLFRRQPKIPKDSTVKKDQWFNLIYPMGCEATARFILSEAKKNVPLFEQLFGWYPSPPAYNDMTLNIYLYGTEEAYYRANYHPQYPQHLGMCQSVFDADRGRLEITGLHLNPSLYKQCAQDPAEAEPHDREMLATVLRHEMVHAVVLTGMNVNRTYQLPHWIAEGIADYGGECSWRLGGDVPDGDLAGGLLTMKDREGSDYWIGYTAHLAMECWKGRPRVEAYAHELLKGSWREAVVRGARTSPELWDAEWRRQIRQGAFRSSPAPFRKAAVSSARITTGNCSAKLCASIKSLLV